MQLHYRLDRDTLLHALRMQTDLPKTWLVGGLVFGAVILAFGHWGPLKQGSMEAILMRAAAVVAAGTAFGVSVGAFQWDVLLPWSAAILARNSAKLMGEMICDADEVRIRFTGPHSVSAYPWGDLYGFRQNRWIFQIRLSKRASLPIPKRDLSPEEIAAFGELCARKLGARRK